MSISEEEENSNEFLSAGDDHDYSDEDYDDDNDEADDDNTFENDENGTENDANVSISYDQGQSESSEPINFDHDIIGRHSYLGENLRELHGRTVLNSGDIVRLPVMHKQNVVLLPGQKLPLILHHRWEIETVLRAVQSNRTIAFLATCDFPVTLHSLTDCIGTTAEVMSIHQDADDPAAATLLNALLIGRQRIKSVEIFRDELSRWSASVRILPELDAPRRSLGCTITRFPLSNVVPNAWKRYGMGWKRRQVTMQANNQPERRTRTRSSRRSDGNDAAVDAATAVTTTETSEQQQPITVTTAETPELTNETEEEPSQTAAAITSPLSAASDALQLDTVQNPVLYDLEHPSRRRSSSSSSNTNHHHHQLARTESVSAASSSSTTGAAIAIGATTTTNTTDDDDDDNNNNEDAREGGVGGGASTSISADVWLNNLANLHANPLSLSCARLSTWKSSNSASTSTPRIPARRDLHAAIANMMMPFPHWVYAAHDVEALILQISEALGSWNATWQLDQWTSDLAAPFSYWLILNLPMPSEYKVILLEMDLAAQRLRFCLDMIIKCASFVCVGCDEEITQNRYVICLAREGAMQAFVNQHGVIHDMFTVSQVIHVRFHGTATDEHSWFPGYKWRIMTCARCSSHLGWSFTASRSSMRPQRFFGLSRTSVNPQLTSNSTNAHAHMQSTRTSNMFMIRAALINSFFPNL